MVHGLKLIGMRLTPRWTVLMNIRMRILQGGTGVKRYYCQRQVQKAIIGGMIFLFKRADVLVIRCVKSNLST